MENFLNQMRVKFTSAEENKADSDGGMDKRIPIQKTQTFKEKNKGQNWLQKQFARKTSRDYDSKEIEHAAAVAATAYAIDSAEVAQQHMKKGETPETSLTRAKSKVDGTKSPVPLLASASKRFSGSFRSTHDDQGKKKPEKEITPAAPSMKKASTFTDKKPETPAPKVPPPPPPPPPIRQVSTKANNPMRPPTPADNKRETSSRQGIGETEADAWERAELQKIGERYYKLKETIDSWENKKKLKAKRKLNKQESELERRRLQALEEFQNNMKVVDQIAREAKTKAEERRKNEELKTKEKANVIRTTGKLPGICSCF